MNLQSACTNILNQLGSLVHQIHEEDFVKPSVALNHSTVGQHLRHTLEFFICLERGVEAGLVNYDKRGHDKLIEQDKFIALAIISKISDFVVQCVESKALKLQVGYDLDKEEYVTIETNLLRELAYNIEHAVHHMAIIKIGLKEVAPYIQLPPDFGVAASTIRYQEADKASH